MEVLCQALRLIYSKADPESQQLGPAAADVKATSDVSLSVQTKATVTVTFLPAGQVKLLRWSQWAAGLPEKNVFIRSRQNSV